MLRHANKLFLPAVLVSVVVHGVAAAVGSRFIYLGGWTVASRLPDEEMTVTLEDPPEPEPAKPPELDPELNLGDPIGSGYASFAAEGVREQLARLAENDQAALSLDPRGSGESGQSGGPQVDFAAPSRPPAAVSDPRHAKFSAQPAAAMFGVVSSIPKPKPARAAETVEAAPKVDAVRPNETQGSPMVVAPTGALKADAQDEAPSRVDVPQPLVAATPAPAAPRPPTPPAQVARQSRSGDPAPQSDRESDPFSSIGSVEFREGHLAVRAGREVKPRRPKLTLAGKVSLFQMQGATIVLGVSTDATGKVTGAEVVESSGSVDLDQPTLVAMYEWWFEPKKDASGQPMPDRFRFTITWR
jgi:TonB family protein